MPFILCFVNDICMTDVDVLSMLCWGGQIRGVGCAEVVQHILCRFCGWGEKRPVRRAEVRRDEIDDEKIQPSVNIKTARGGSKAAP